MDVRVRPPLCVRRYARRNCPLWERASMDRISDDPPRWVLFAIRMSAWLSPTGARGPRLGRRGDCGRGQPRGSGGGGVPRPPMAAALWSLARDETVSAAKILHMHFGKEGGAERFFVSLATAFAERGMEQRFVIRPGRMWRDEVAALGPVIENHYRRLSVSALFLT